MLEVCRAVADRVPVVLMVYANMVLAHGGAVSSRDRCAPPGAAGAIVPDLPLDEAEEIREALAADGLALVPAGGADHRRPSAAGEICEAAEGFVYVVSDVGTTGERAALPAELAELVGGDQGRRGDDPGRGRVRDRRLPEQAAEVGAIADGVIIGSRLVRAAGEAGSPAGAADAVAEFLTETRVALAG